MSAKRGRGLGQRRRGKGEKDLADVCELVFVYYSSMYCGRFLWVMPKYKLYIILLFVLYNLCHRILWVGTEYYGLALMGLHIWLPGSGCLHELCWFYIILCWAACCDEEINEQCILRAPAITLADHRALSNARCECSQGGGMLYADKSK